MNEAEFRKWMVDQGHSLATQNTQAQDAKRLEAHYGDLDEAFDADGLEGIKAELAYSKADERAGKKNPARFPIDGNLYANLSHYRSTLNYYIQFRSGTAVSGYDSLEADKRIALFDDAGTAHWPVRQTNRQSGVKAFRIMGSSNRTEDAIETDDILAVARALFKEQRLVRVLRSNNGRRPYLGYGKQKLTSYEIDAEIAAALGIPAKGSIHGNDLILDHAELAKLKARFLRTYPDFEPHGFAGSTSRVFDDVINYKRDAVAKVAALIQSEPPLALEALGAALFDILTGIDLPGWRTNNRLAAIRKQHPNVLEHAAAELARSISDPPAAAHRMVEAIWPVLVEGQDKSKPYSESRNIPSMFLALVRPRDALGINTDPLSQAYKALVRKPLFGWNPLTANEYAEALRFANTLFDEMVSWGWQPRDLWDVQSFLWVVKQEDQAADAIPTSSEMRPSMPSATNLILYGPPGTGKTYATAAEALEICNGPGSAPLERKELMEVYQSLHRKGRIGFVTFHQSFSYEEFVEGLRPVTGEESDDGPATGGFSLKPHDGIFKQIANLAAENRGHAVAVENSLLDRTQKIFKMSLGRSWAAEDDAIFQDAIRDGYIVLGYGGEVDWSDPRFDKWEAIKERWREDHPAATGNDPNMSQMYAFRINMEVGSLVVVSDGNRKFRAIGEITGEYRFVPGPNGEYNHRRSVKWLWHSDESLPRERIYGKTFSQVSVYQLNSRYIDWDALEQIVTSGGEAVATTGVPEPYVLIIDEINRANISKVFGELITLLEPDKRIGEENELRVKLPYSGEIFGVPANLHIIGTMNTADRSIALLDTALRRRFTFRELMPDAEALPEAVDGVPLRKVLAALNERIEYLFDREHQIGHAYFMGCSTRSDVDQCMRHKVIPLLAEYFYEDWSKVAAVLGDTAGERFLERRELKAPNGLDSDGDAPPRWRWQVRRAFTDDAFKGFA
tara:strand:- start:43619 stop:46498 length:2880 start_codon:yes stop_codon:yes gene_type:complete